ncbi:MAG: ShlB/FhaC/HecB family hemolysin secretion/activation protein [Herbaspirillum sp.]
MNIAPFRFLQTYLAGYEGRYIGQSGIETIIRRATRQIIERGYSTTRVGVGSQDLSSGEIKIALVPGIIHAIRFKDPAVSASYRSAFPNRAGDLLNLRDLEQGLEQMKRVASQDVDMQIAPTQTPGESDIVLDVKRIEPWKATLNFDDSGAKSTGKYQAGINVAIDNLLGINDLFNAGFSSDADRKGDTRGTTGNNFSYSAPASYWTFGVSGSAYQYHQQIAGKFQTFGTSGASQNLEVRIQRLFQRDPQQKNSLQLRISKRWSRSYLNDTEIGVHRRHPTFAELSWIHRHYYGDAQLDATLANRWGVGWFNGAPDAPDRAADSPTYRYSMQTLDATLVVPFKLSTRTLTYIGTIRAQHSNSRLYLSDQSAIGSRYTVRGFDGELTLASENGVFWRNNLEIALGRTGSALYLGLDAGRLYGHRVPYLQGDALAGAAVGLRGGIGSLHYDLFAGWALVRPQQFQTATPAAGFNLIYQF